MAQRNDNPHGGYGQKQGQNKKPYGKKPYAGGSGSGSGKPYGKKPYNTFDNGTPRADGYRQGNAPAERTDAPRQGSYGKKPYNKFDNGAPRADGYRQGGYDKRDQRPYGTRDAFRRDGAPARYGAEAEEAIQPQTEQDELPFLIIGRNAVREAVKSGRSIDRIVVTAEQDGSLREILTLARDRKLVIREVDRKKLDELCMPFGHGGHTANHQGIAAYAAGVEYCGLDDILAVAKERNEEPFVVVLDGVLDPHNLGGILRSAECAGAHGVVIGKRRSASVTAAAVKAAAGATEHIKVARVVNIPAALEQLKKRRLWIAGADMAGRPMTEQGMNGALALVIGGEGDGLSKLVRDSCDFLVSIPMFGKIDSLNASVAAGILRFEKKRQDAVQAQA